MHLLKILLQRQALYGAAASGLGVLDDVLVVVDEREIGYFESLLSEKTRMGAWAEIGAVFVINVPKGAFAEHTLDVRCFEHDPSIVARTKHLADRANEIRNRCNVL